MRILNLVILLAIAGIIAYGFNKFKSLFSGFFGASAEPEQKLIEVISSTDVQPKLGRYDDYTYDQWIKAIEAEFNDDKYPLKKDEIVSFLEDLQPHELKYFISRFGVRDFEVGFGFFTKTVKSLNLMQVLALEYDKGLWGAVSGTSEQRERLVKAFARINVVINF